MVNTLSELSFNVSLSQSPLSFSHVLEFHERHLHPQYIKYGLLVTETQIVELNPNQHGL